MHSTAPVFSGGGNWVREGRLAVGELQEECVVLIVLNGGELTVDHTSPFVKILRNDHAHVAKREKVVDIILEGNCGHRCSVLEHASHDYAVDTICWGAGH